MYKILVFAQREYMASVTSKGFIIGLVLAPVMMGGSLIAFALLKDRVDTADKHIAIIDLSQSIYDFLFVKFKGKVHIAVSSILIAIICI